MLLYKKLLLMTFGTTLVFMYVYIYIFAYICISVLPTIGRLSLTPKSITEVNMSLYKTLRHVGTNIDPLILNVLAS